MSEFYSRYGKSLWAFLFAVVTATQALISDGHLTQQEGIQVAIAAVTAFAVYLFPSMPQWPWVKTVIALFLAVLNVAATAIVGGIDSGDLTELILAALTVLSVGKAPSLSGRRTAGLSR
jgi:hypothetical protein